MIRTQYNRTAFQIPFDATVRVSLDTNLAMIKENIDGQPVALLHRFGCLSFSLPFPFSAFPSACLPIDAAAHVTLNTNSAKIKETIGSQGLSCTDLPCYHCLFYPSLLLPFAAFLLPLPVFGLLIHLPFT